MCALQGAELKSSAGEALTVLRVSQEEGAEEPGLGPGFPASARSGLVQVGGSV